MYKTICFAFTLLVSQQVAAGDLPWLTRHKMDVVNPLDGLQTVRKYALHVPKSYDPAKKTPLLVWFHGQSDEWPSSSTFYKLGEKHTFISVYPRGYGDFNGTDQLDYIAWNVGRVDDDKCMPDTQPTCYDSCLKPVNQCSRCFWSTCVDDTYFIDKLLTQLKSDYNIDERAIFASGASNGGMFIHYLTSLHPSWFRAVVPVYGNPLTGMLNVPEELSNVPIMSMHDRKDTTVPWKGGISDGGWIFPSTSEVLAVWARVHKCKSSLKLKGVNTPFDGGNSNMYCQEYKKCKNGRVLSCFFDGQHGAWPKNIEKLIWWFFQQYLPVNEKQQILQ